MKVSTAFAICAAATGLLAAPAAAQSADTKWFVRGGVTQLTLADDIELSLGGAPVPNSGLSTKSHYTPTIQLGHFVAENFAVSLTGGLPPHIKIDGADALAPFGTLAETTYGPATLTLQYRPLRNGTVQPYVGAGAAYMHVFSVTDGAFQDAEIDNDLAPALEAGADIMFTERYGVFVEAKRAFLRTQTRGTFGGAPVVGDVRLDPWAVSVGGTFRF
jgi:outer membrane protein